MPPDFRASTRVGSTRLGSAMPRACSCRSVPVGTFNEGRKVTL